MSDIGFYHLTRTSVSMALPALLSRTLATGEKALIMCPDEPFLATLDDALWKCDDWLPHGRRDFPHPAWQPIYLTTDAENPANARFLFRVGGVEAAAEGFIRVFDLFDGNDENEVLAARQRWRTAKAANHSLTYWKQEDQGWVKAG